MISNQVSVTANTSGGINVSDLSDDGDDNDGNTEDDPTTIQTSPAAKIEVTKTALVIDTNSNGNNDQGDVIVYTIAVANTGSVTLSGLTLTDTLTDASGGSLSLSSGPTFNSNSASSLEGSLASRRGLYLYCNLYNKSECGQYGIGKQQCIGYCEYTWKQQ